MINVEPDHSAPRLAKSVQSATSVDAGVEAAFGGVVWDCPLDEDSALS